MHQEPVSPDPGPSCPDWMDDPAYLAMRAEDEDPGDLDLDDPDDDPPPDVDPEELAAEAERITADRARAAEVAARLGLTAAVAADAAAAAGSGDAGVRGELPGGVCQPGVGVRVGEAAGYRAGMLDAGAVRGGGGRGG
jgi:hypothetical protein